MLHFLQRFTRSDEGATAVEYAVMLALILMVCIASIALVGSNTAATWMNNSNSIGAATGS